MVNLNYGEQTLKDARKEAGYSQEYMANELGISRQTYANIEKDPSSATVLQARSICRILSKNYERIFFGLGAS